MYIDIGLLILCFIGFVLFSFQSFAEWYMSVFFALFLWLILMGIFKVIGIDSDFLSILSLVACIIFVHWQIWGKEDT